MKMRKRTIWISVLILLTLTPFVMIFVDSMRPHYTKILPSILGVEKVESEFIDSESTWIVNYEVYKLSDATVKELLAKENKELYKEEGYKKLNWTKWSIVDSLWECP